MTTQTSQCDSCAFKLIEDQSTEFAANFVEEKYRSIRGAKGAPKKSRNIFVGGDGEKTETCFIDSPEWERRSENVHCPDRIDNTISLEMALDFHESRSANVLARCASATACRANTLSIIAIIVAIVVPLIIWYFQ